MRYANEAPTSDDRIEVRIEGLRELNPGSDDCMFELFGVTPRNIDFDLLAEALGYAHAGDIPYGLGDEIGEIVFRRQLVETLADRIVVRK